MSILQDYIQSVQSGQWARIDPRTCPCKGQGWMLSDLDTWHRCPVHSFEGMAHPEEDQPSDITEFKAWAAKQVAGRTEMLRGLFRQIRAENAKYATYAKGEYLKAVEHRLSAGDLGPATPEAYVCAALDVLGEDMALHAEGCEHDFEDNNNVEEPYEVAHGPRW